MAEEITIFLVFYSALHSISFNRKRLNAWQSIKMPQVKRGIDLDGNAILRNEVSGQQKMQQGSIPKVLPDLA